MGDTRLSLEYLTTCSDAGLESLELVRMSEAAELRKAFRRIFEQWVAVEAEARAARWMIESRRAEKPVREVSLTATRNSESEQIVMSFLQPPSASPDKSCPMRRPPALDSHSPNRLLCSAHTSTLQQLESRAPSLPLLRGSCAGNFTYPPAPQGQKRPPARIQRGGTRAADQRSRGASRASVQRVKVLRPAVAMA